MKKTVLLLLPVLFFEAAQAQSFEPFVTASAGTFASSPTATMAWTVGEIMTETYTSGGKIFTQGFHQPFALKASVAENDLFDHVNVFPNPVISYLFVEFTEMHDECRLELVDLQGRILYSDAMTSGQMRTTIPFGDFSDGMYLLRLIDTKTYFSSLYKINKIK